MSKITSKVGETKMMKCGMRATVIEYIDYRNATIRFEDGTILKNRYYNFKNGTITNPNLHRKNCLSKIGEEKEQRMGYVAKLIEYNNCNDVVIQFKDGTKARATYSQFKSGIVSHKDVSVNRNLKNRCVGKKFVNSQGFKYEIIKYESYEKVTVKFEDGLEKIVSYQRIKEKNGVSHNSEKNNVVKTDRINQVFISNNGLTAKIIEYKSNKELKVQFEDGTVVKTVMNSLKGGTFSHPELNSKQKCFFKNFECLLKIKNEKNFYYKCKCKKCGLETLLTPQQMIAHYNICKGD